MIYKNKCKIICIEGLDGAGKSSVINGVQQMLLNDGYTVRTMKFPRYDTAYGEAISTMQKDTLLNLPGVAPALAGALYTLDRISYFKANQEAYMSITDCDYLLLDRSYFSNFMYQGTKFTQFDDRVIGWDEKIYQWLADQFNAEIVETGLSKYVVQVIYLTASAEVRIRQLGSRNKTESLDMNEKNVIYQNRISEFMNSLYIDSYNTTSFIEGLTQYISEPVLTSILNYYMKNVTSVPVISGTNPDEIKHAIEFNCERVYKAIKKGPTPEQLLSTFLLNFVQNSCTPGITLKVEEIRLISSNVNLSPGRDDSDDHKILMQIFNKTTNKISAMRITNHPRLGLSDAENMMIKQMLSRLDNDRIYTAIVHEVENGASTKYTTRTDINHVSVDNEVINNGN